MTSRGSSPDPIDELFTAVEQFFATTWDSISSGAPNLHDLPHTLHDQFNSLLDKVTNNHTLPLPSWNDIPAAPWSSATDPAPVITPPLPSSQSGLGSQFSDKITRHPYLAAALATTLTGATAYYINPTATVRTLSPLFAPLRPYIPISLLPTSSRPLRVIPSKGPSSAGATQVEIRKEALLVLGAQGVVADLALDLESRGFVVIATVSNPSDVDALEKRSRGWIKVLVLDPTEVSGGFEQSFDES